MNYMSYKLATASAWSGISTACPFKADFKEPTSSSVLDGVFCGTDANGYLSSDWQTIPELRTDSTSDKPDIQFYKTTRTGSTYQIPEKALPLLNRQRDAVAAYYQGLYNPSMGADILPGQDKRTLSPQSSQACKEMIQLLADGLKAVRKLEDVDPAVGAHFKVNEGTNGQPTISVGTP